MQLLTKLHLDGCFFRFDVGDRVITENGKNGVVKFLGPVDGYEEITAGVVLDRPIGKTDGTVNVSGTVTVAATNANA